MPRKFYRKTYKYGGRDKYSVEHTTVNMTTAATGTQGMAQSAANIIPASPTQGMRKVKHLTISLNEVPPAQGTVSTIWWAVVYVPEGYNVNPLNGNPGASFYEPNQFVMAAGCNDPQAGPVRIHSPVSRNLNSGDSIWLVVGTNTFNTPINGVVSYAITLQ